MKILDNLRTRSSALTKKAKTRFVYVRTHRKIYQKRVTVFIRNHPYRSLFLVLGIFLLLMIVGNVFLGPKKEKEAAEAAPKQVKVYSVGKAAEISYQGKVEKSGVAKIVAQAPGVVEAINVTEGQEIAQGTNILSMASNYSGGNALTVARQLAGVQYQNAKDTYDAQKGIIAQQRQLADKSKDNAAAMRDIANSSAGSTASLISLQQDIVNNLQSTLDSMNPSDPNYRTTQGQLAAAKSGLIQTQSAYNNLQIQTNNTSTDIANLNHDIAIKQLDLQEKSLQSALNAAGLQFRLASINEAAMFLSSPFSGKVDKIFVHVGDAVNPGTPLAQISGDSQHGEVVVMVPSDIAKSISYLDKSTIDFGKRQLSLFPTSVSRDATNGTLYAVIYDLGDVPAGVLTDAAYVNVKIPIGIADTTNIDPFVPLDAVFQTQESAFIYVVDANNRAKSYRIKLGQIQGDYVEALTGVPKDAKVIVNRNVIEGDKVEITR